MTIRAFWEQQAFSYLATYSFNRGAKLAESIERATQELQTARFMRQPAMRQQLEELKRGHYLLTKNLGALHSTATLVAQVFLASAEAQQLASAFAKSAGQVAYSGCIPAYRDALAFYNEQHELQSVLNICFECWYMKTDAGILVEADGATYNFLRKFLKRLGHPINE
jgi:hypothetical protein